VSLRYLSRLAPGALLLLMLLLLLIFAAVLGVLNRGFT
jgi:hypothetical protein